MNSKSAHLYNLLHTGNDGDTDYYSSTCSPNQTVLELGVGNGRIGHSLAQKGCHVTGIDNDEAMLEACAKQPEKNFVCQLADMRSFQLDKQFDKIIIPFNGLLCLLNENDVHATFTSVARHLKPTGEFIFDIYYVPRDFKNEGEQDDGYIDTTVLNDSGTPIHVFEKTHVLNDPQRFDTSYLFVYDYHSPFENYVELLIKQRCLYIEQIKHLLTKAGLQLNSITSDFTNEPVHDDTSQLIIRATLPEKV